MIIYIVTNKINGKQYVGQTVRRLEQRKCRHISDASDKKITTHFHRAIRKHGLENFTWEILTKCDTIEELNKLEIYYIKMYDTFNNGYNLTLGGEGVPGCIPSNETRKKLSELQEGKNNSFYGKRHSEKTRREMSETRRGENHNMYGKRGEDNPRWGMKHTKESRLKMSRALKGKNCGKKRSEEMKKRMSEVMKGEKNPNYGKFGKDSNYAKAVIINGKYFHTCKEAAKFVEIDPSAIGRRIKRQHPGYQYA